MRFQSLAISLSLLAAIGAGPLSAQGPGDKSKLTAVHPGYDLANLMPAGFQPGITGMDFLSDGRVAICTWGGTHVALVPPTKKGELWIVANSDASDVSKVTATKLI